MHERVISIYTHKKIINMFKTIMYQLLDFAEKQNPPTKIVLGCEYFSCLIKELNTVPQDQILPE